MFILHSFPCVQLNMSSTLTKFRKPPDPFKETIVNFYMDYRNQSYFTVYNCATCLDI